METQEEKHKLFVLTPEFIAGVFAAEGSFGLVPSENWFRPNVTFVLNKVDGNLVYLMRDYFGFGKEIRERPEVETVDGHVGPALEWEVDTTHEALKILDFFNTEPTASSDVRLWNNKQLSFFIWSMGVKMLNELKGNRNKENRDQARIDLKKISENINPLGYKPNEILNPVLKDGVYEASSIEEKIAQCQRKHDQISQYELAGQKLKPNYVAGYVTGDGGFSFGWRTPPPGKKTPTFQWNMNVTSADEHILKAMRDFFNAGNVYKFRNKEKKTDYYRLMITNSTDFMRIYEEVFIPYPLFGKKKIDADLLYKALLALARKPNKYGPIPPSIRAELNTCVELKKLNCYL